MPSGEFEPATWRLAIALLTTRAGADAHIGACAWASRYLYTLHQRVCAVYIALHMAHQKVVMRATLDFPIEIHIQSETFSGSY